MENASTAGTLAVVEPIERGRFRARIMGKSLSTSGKSKDSGEHLPAGRTPASALDSSNDRPGFGGASYTLRIKPDRRRAAIPMNPETDRRRSR